MSISNFSVPSDQEVLKNLEHNQGEISFWGAGRVYQQLDKTKYYRIIRLKQKEEESYQKVIFEKRGISWRFKKTEAIAQADLAHPFREN